MVIDLFACDDYREYLRAYFKSLPRAGYGQLSKTAKALGIQPSLLTCILQGTKNLTVEQALDLTSYLQFKDLEVEYFVLLVQLDRAGTDRLRQHLSGKLEAVRAQANNIKSRLPPKTELPEQVKAQFYSQWYYSAVRLATSIEGLNAPELIAARLGLDRKTVLTVLEFLLSQHLVVETNGKYGIGPLSTHLGSGEILASRQHTNWRLKAIEKLNRDAQTDLHFTSPVSISVGDIEVVRKLLLRTLDQIFEIVDPSPAEELACICLDWYKL